MDHEFPAFRSELRDYSNVFFLAPSLGSRGEEGCMELSTLVAPERASVLVVTAVQTPDDRLDAWRTRVDEGLPDRMAFVEIGGATRSAGTGTSTIEDPAGGTIPVEPVPEPGNLTRLGVVMTNHLNRWEGDSGDIVVCFRPLTTLLQYADVRKVFRFLHELVRHSKTAGAVAHYHLDPTAHDEQTINRLKTLFNAVVEPDGDGGWTVKAR